MKASRKLDALIAEKVMGWTVFRVGHVGTDDETPEQIRYATELEKSGVESVGWYVLIGETCVLWESEFEENYLFSSSIADAWMVVEKMRRDGLWFLLEYEEPPQCCYASFYAPIDATNEIGSRGNAYADTAPLAICLAALKAVGVEVSE